MEYYFYGKEVPPPPPPPPDLNWYSGLVVIFDSTDMVYLYCTERTCTYVSNANEILQKYPNYIGLHPEDLLSFTSEEFITFIRNNKEILNLDTNIVENTRIFHVVSNHDTIQNTSFYKFANIVTRKKGPKFNDLHGLVRITTEEENNVIYAKRHKSKYIPECLKWSKHFLSGDSSPFTAEYDSLEKQLPFVIKASRLLQKPKIKILPIM